MGRYRPPAPPSSAYITAEGARRLQEELDRLWRRERPEVVRALSEAAAEGDRSENAEYIYRKKQLAGIDRRVRYLRKRLAVVEVIDRRPEDTGRVFFGAWVTVEDDRGGQREVRIVGPDEFDHAPGFISMDSPLGRALLRSREGDEVRVATPEGRRDFIVMSVRYGVSGA
ncbi:MAG: transcription elongation factor GreB [Gammaproteobacteria bacterium]